MAQHIQIDTFDNKAIKKIAKSIRGYRYFETSMKFNLIDDEQYHETVRDRVYVTSRTVPNSIVHGGKALFEVHTTPASGSGRIVTNIYLVA
jgi:hypothetical protein